MLQRHFWKIIILLETLTSLTSAKFDLKLKYCRFKCDEWCKKEDSDMDPDKEVIKPAAYYWRDFYGDIPDDAYPLGPPTQNPQTYIGIVLDAPNNGQYTTTIFEGLNFVYSGSEGNTTHKTEQIKILCTLEPENMIWMKLTLENIKSIGDDKPVKGGLIRGTNNWGINFITKSTKCGITYAGYINRLAEPMKYIQINGNFNTTEEFMNLLYRPKKKGEMNPQAQEDKSFFSHHYEYRIQSKSIIPKFFKQLNAGPCSIICTNEMGKKKKITNKKILSSLAYYWKPNDEFDAKEALKVGSPGDSDRIYIGQTYDTGGIYDVGSTSGDSVYLSYGKYVYVLSDFTLILSTDHPEKFEWVNSTTDSFPMLDQSRMIPGGMFLNGTKTFVGREIYVSKYSPGKVNILPGSIRQIENGTFIASFYGSALEFQVLLFKDEQKIS
ncbi:hypothetical protein HHI36_011174 [Cryptolaemus montrouzieri]|uniref:Uncharacterized protein n=1 Tax=Cryptolaemus montrouzieri TaxID=559131 RepID=A0ABD2MKV7_9CUCU